jgi:hypothetical protein
MRLKSRRFILILLRNQDVSRRERTATGRVFCPVSPGGNVICFSLAAEFRLVGSHVDPKDSVRHDSKRLGSSHTACGEGTLSLSSQAESRKE